MTGYYFINTDLRNTRAHTSQVLHTAAALSAHLPLALVSPAYPNLDRAALAARHGLEHPARLVPLWNFGLKDAGFLSFLLFNIPAIVFLISQKLKGEVSFIYVRASYFLPLVCVARLLRVPCFFETHRRPITRGERLREGLIAKLARGLVVVSAEVGRHFAHTKKPMVVVHDAVDLLRFQSVVSKEEARQHWGIAAGARVCVYTGSVSNLKGVNYLVEAATLLPETAFLLAGRITENFKHKVLPENVSLLGQKEQEELPELLRAADVLVLPHPHNDYSQSPMKLFEYMASGTPLVSSRLPSLEEILNERNAVLVRPDSGEALARGIEQIFDGPEAAARLAAQAKADVQEYTWEARGKKIAAFIRTHIRHD